MADPNRPRLIEVSAEFDVEILQAYKASQSSGTDM